MISWTSILPVELTAEVVGRINVKADATCNNEMFLTQGPQGGPSPTLGSQSPRFNPLLVKLVNAMPDIRQVPRTHSFRK